MLERSSSLPYEVLPAITGGAFIAWKQKFLETVLYPLFQR